MTTADEDRFYALMSRDKFDVVLPPRTLVLDPKYPGNPAEIDNIGQKNATIFVLKVQEDNQIQARLGIDSL